MQKSFKKGKTCTKSFMKEVSNAREVGGKGGNMQKSSYEEKYPRKMPQQKQRVCFATKAFHKGKIKMKKPL